MKTNITPKNLKVKFYVVTFLSLRQQCLCISLVSILISSNAKLESNSRKQRCTEGRPMHISYMAHMAPRARAGSSPAPLQILESQLQEVEGTSHHLVQFLTLLQEAGLLALHLEPFKMLSGSASEERNPTVLWLTQCVFYSRSQEIGYFLSRLLGAEGGLSHL